MEMSHKERHAVQSKQGRVVFGVDMKIVGADGMELPWDGATSGDLLVHGSSVVCDYFRNEGDSPLNFDDEGQGWFPTGDVATIDANGFMQITDRSKDVIKSGGEWIGSIDLEISPWLTQRYPWRRASRPAIRSGTSGRCS
ncbi:long-chain-fatty-acid--CoA ligase [Caballeronia turbans]|jgi:fatty-acyl-CoA synthase|nr:long-chain-fatty-acid--CoA ligase [Caballeronia turbans]